MTEEKKKTNLKLMLMDKLPGYNTLVKPLHLAKAVAAGARYALPARKLKVIGVTGTNGKTTTCFMIWKMLNESGRKTGLMTTVAWGVKRLQPELNHMTTEDSMTLNRRIKEMRDQGAEYLVLEVTSHAMSQFRTLGVPVEIAVFTNLTHEHLDYHKTIQKYRAAKCKLFKKARFGVINADDGNSKWFMKASREYVTYGIKNGKLRGRKIKLSPNGVQYACGDMKLKVQIPGEFNVYNSLAAIAVGQKLGLTDKEIENGINALESVEGRMTRVDEGQDFTVIVDYAHTPDALEKAFKALGEVKGKVISVHGGAGRRDESTRAERGEILAKYSDYVIITEDDSRDEDPSKIAQQFVKGAEAMGKREGSDLMVNLNREEAIKEAIKLAKKGDIVMLLGKGHEKTILRADGPHEFEDIKIAQKYLRDRAKEDKEEEEMAEKLKKLREAALKREAARRKLEEDVYGNITE